MRCHIPALVALFFVGGPSAVALQTNAPEVASPTAVTTEVVTRGLAHPWALQVLPDGRYLVSERPGRLRIVTPNGDVGPPIAGMPDITFNRQGGLLDVALAPDFAESGTIYFSYSEPRGGQETSTSVARAVLRLDGAGGRLESLTRIFQQQPAVSGGFHYGSRIVFGTDGSLFVTLGERNSARTEAQNPGNHIGKVVHIKPDGAPAAPAPAGQGWDPLVWSIGHRNIQGAAIHPSTGVLWTVEHGARGGDELNRPQSGKNYGWPVITYGRDYSGASIGEGSSKPGMEQPIYYWDPSIATSSLMFYSGRLFKDWAGNALVGGLAVGVERLVLENDSVVSRESLLGDLGERVRDVREAPDGSILVLTDDPRDGQIIRMKPK